jgi:lipopolysaccharide/colanic/teichoic acid biosynthesis glycosyltransferase
MAMKFVLKNIGVALHKMNGKATAPLPQVEKNFHSPELFKQRLVIEKRRAERLNTNASLIVLRLRRHGKRRSRNETDEDNLPRQDLAHLARMICTIIRETDAVSLHKNNTILILLPDTDTEGAQLVCEKLLKLAEKSAHLQPVAEKIKAEDIDVQIFSYPGKTNRKEPPEESGDRGPDKSEFRPDPLLAFQKASRTSFQKRYLENLNLCVSTVNGASIATSVVKVFFWDLVLRKDLLTATARALKKSMDMIGAVAGLVLFSPAMLVTAVLVKITSPGPILFKQKRLGYKGKYFTFLKFRSMYINSEDRVHQEYVKKLINGKTQEINNGSADHPYYKITTDSRITPVGRFIRKTSLDELPQLWNVLRGEMSLVGPRPPIHYEVEEYKSWHYRRILEAKPGITGLWQISDRNRTTFDEMVRLDLWYARNWSLALDMKILLKTFKVILLAEGR